MIRKIILWWLGKSIYFYKLKVLGVVARQNSKRLIKRYGNAFWEVVIRGNFCISNELYN